MLLEQNLNHYLWSGNDNIKAKAKVAWNQICVPNREGGLGLKRVNDWNKASMLRHTWNLFARACSFWVAWVKMYLLRGRWEVDEEDIRSISMVACKEGRWEVNEEEDDRKVAWLNEMKEELRLTVAWPGPRRKFVSF